MTTALPERRDAEAPQAMRLRVEALRWQRIQLIARLRPVGGRPDVAAVSLALVRLDEGVPGASSGGRTADRMPPTRARWEGTDLVSRFNFMQGPRQLPLAPGSWRVVATTPTTGAATEDGEHGIEHGVRHGVEVEVEVEDPAGLVAAQPAASFATPRGRYGVALRHVAGRGVVLDVSLGPVAGTTPASGRGWRGRGEDVVRRVGRRLRRAVFRLAVGAARRLTRGRGPAILFTSSTRPALGGNLAAVHDRMVERGLVRDVEVLFSFKPDLHERTPWRERLRLPFLLGRSDVIVIDDFHPVVGALDDSRVRIVQLWHASGVVKTILYSRIGKPDSPDPWSRDYKNVSCAIVSSENDVPHFAEAFGIPEERVIPTGIPRMDRFFDEAARARGREAALAAFPAARGRRVILFAPTFRGSGRHKSYDLGVLDYPALHALCVEKDAVFVIRLHPRIRRSLDIPASLRDRLIDGSDVATDAPDILFATDLLVTDYSSIIFEFAVLDRPMLFFAPDLDAYRESVDFYEPYESLVPGKVVRTMPELVAAIRTEDFERERLAPFTQRHLAHLDGRATDRVIDQLIVPGLRRR